MLNQIWVNSIIFFQEFIHCTDIIKTQLVSQYWNFKQKNLGSKYLNLFYVMQTKERIYLYRENLKQNLPSLADSWSFSAIRSLRFRPHRFANSINFRLSWWQIVHETLVILNESLDDCQIIWQWFSLQFNQGVFFAYQPLHEFIKECQEILKLFEMILNKNGLLIVTLGMYFFHRFLYS